MPTKTIFKKFVSIALSMSLIFCVSFSLMSSDALFTSYTSSSNGTYSYTKNPLGCNYSQSWEKSLCGNGKKWQMGDNSKKILL